MVQKRELPAVPILGELHSRREVQQMVQGELQLKSSLRRSLGSGHQRKAARWWKRAEVKSK